MDTIQDKTTLMSEGTNIFMITLFLLVVAVGIIMLVLVYQKKQLQYLREKEQLKVAFDKEILESKLEIQEQTLKNISQEIHDNIGQALSLAKLTINTMSHEEPEVLQEKVNASKQLLSKAIQDLRDLSKSMDTDYVSNIGLAKAIERELELVQRSGSFTAELLQEGLSYKLPENHELVLFRIFQEVLTNIIKHSKANYINVQAHYLPLNFLLHIKDNGQGFVLQQDKKNQAEPTGLGLYNMKNRARMMHGSLDIDSRPGEGTSVKINIPVS